MRFPEFSGEWEQHSLSDYLRFKNGLNPDAKRFGKGIKFISVMDILNNASISYDCVRASVAATEQEISDFEVEYGDVLFQRSSETLEDIGRSNIYVDSRHCVFGGFVIRGKKIGEYEPYFMKYRLDSPYARKSIIVKGAGAQHFNIGQEGLSKVELFFPKYEEQVKIGDLLRIIDDRINTQSKIIEELTTLRSALYDSIFCSPEQEMPKFRIQSFSGKWQLCQLNEICSRKSIKNKDNLYSRVLTIAAQHGLVDQESFFKKRIASENLESYLCLEKGDFAYNKSYSSDYPWGAVKRLSNFDKGIISPLYICFTPKPEVVDPDYLAHYFESTKWHSGISEISGEGARNHGLLNMSVIDYFNTCHRIPGLDEQKAIAIRLNAIAHKLQTEQEYLELLNRQKDCFLKQMFI